MIDDEIFEPNVYINEIENVLCVIQIYLDKLKRSICLIELSDAVADDAELASDISNNTFVVIHHEMVLTEIEHTHFKPTLLLDDLLGKTTYELHNTELNKLFPSGYDEQVGPVVDEDEPTDC